MTKVPTRPDNDPAKRSTSPEQVSWPWPTTIAFGRFITMPNFPDVVAFLPYNAHLGTFPEASGHGWSLPLFVVTADVCEDDVIEAVHTIGSRFRCAGNLTKVARQWVRGAEYRQHNPFRAGRNQLDPRP